jgi:Cu/Ag efflux protein CusF
MRKVLGLTLALMLGLSLSAAAEEKQGKVKSIDRASQSFTLEDGTQLSVSDGTLSELQPGEQVRAAYEVKGGKNLVIEMNRVAIGPDGQATTNFKGMGRDRSNEIQGD